MTRPWPALMIGLAAFPVAKLLWIPNYVFNFLTTLVHECGHAAFAWLMGMPSIPTISPMGGGVTLWQEHQPLLSIGWLVVLGWGAWTLRERKWVWGAAPAAGLLLLLGFSYNGRETVATAGGVLFEIGGAAACFWAVLALELERPFERPLYALWGWWMILNRGSEIVLMLRNRAYWEAGRVIDSGLAAGLPADLHRIQGALGIAPEVFLVVVLLLCIAALPAAWLIRRFGTPA